MAATPVGPVVGAQVPGGANALLNITAATVVKATAGRCVRVSVVVAGSTAGTVNDMNATASAAASNQFGTLPAAVGTYEFEWPCGTGIVVVPGTGQTVAVSFT